MKKLFSIIAVAVGLFAGYSTYNKLQNTKLTGIALANLEALANDVDDADDIEMLDCTRAVSYESCYDSKTKKWVCFYVPYVEHYRVPKNSVLVCHHDMVTKCPSGTYAK